jgi:septum formation protein
VKVILASKSATRAQLLAGAGVAFEATSSGVDEDAAKQSLLAEGHGPRAIADALAELKALKVSRRTSDLVIGADQTLDLDGVLFDKSDTIDEARIVLRRLRGRRHLLHTAVVAAKEGAILWRAVVSPKIEMRDFSDAFLEDYLTREGEAILGSVGCYRLEGLGAQLFAKIDGDHFAVLGLPLIELLGFLRNHGYLRA